MGRQLSISPTDSVSAQGREGRGFDSACETNFLLFKNDLNLKRALGRVVRNVVRRAIYIPKICKLNLNQLHYRPE
jgi:hypothetical protein